MDRFCQECHCGMDVHGLCFSLRFHPLALILIHQCKRHKIGSTDPVLNHGAHVFGMMLAQVCRLESISNREATHQEVHATTLI